MLGARHLRGFMSLPVTPRESTTVVLLRDAPGGVEVFMVRRNANASFMASACVYPGGALDETDEAEELVSFVTGRDPAACAALLGGGISPQQGLAFFLAGVRESFEEAGVLLAHRAGDPARRPVATDEPGVGERFAQWRWALHEREATLVDLAHQENLRFGLDWVHPFAHWITPVTYKKRFDTWFFVARSPARQVLTHDTVETVASEWLRPAEVLRRYGDGENVLFPPTLRTLEELDALGSLDAIIERCATEPIPAILPYFKGSGETLISLLPGDPEYPVPETSPVRRGTSTRFALRDGRWQSI